ncbi:MAG: macro domain-containing protein [Vicinamibacterales bacterium]
MAEFRLHNCVVRVTRGDITELDVDAIVHDARSDMLLAAGYGGAIAVRGGSAVKEQARNLAPVPAGEAVVTTGGKLKAKFVIHAVGPKFREEGEEAKLRSATISALKRAVEAGASTLGLPPLGTGFYGMPVDLCAAVMVEAVAEYLRTANRLSEITFCVRDTWDIAPFERRLSAMSPRDDQDNKGR